MFNKYYTLFVSKSGKFDETAFCVCETTDKNIYERNLKETEKRGYKVAKVYYPTDRI